MKKDLEVVENRKKTEFHLFLENVIKDIPAWNKLVKNKKEYKISSRESKQSIETKVYRYINQYGK